MHTRRDFLRAGLLATGSSLLLSSLSSGAPESKDTRERADVDSTDGPWVNPPTEAQRVSGVEHRSFRSEAMQREIGYNLYLPPSYGSEPTRRYPVVYHLHGRTDSESSHLSNLQLLVDAVQAGSVPEIICVYGYGGRRSQFTDWKNGGTKSETVILELVQHVDQTYRTKPERTQRGLLGWSMGGGGAFKLAFKHPDRFSTAVSFGGGFNTIEEILRRPGIYEDVYGGDPDYYAVNAPLTLAISRSHLVKGRLRLKMIVGEKDHALPGNRRMHRLLQDLGLEHDYVELPGLSHDPRAVYQAAALSAFQFITQSFAAT